MANCTECGKWLGALAYGRCKACAGRLSGHPVPDKIPCATCEGTGEWIRITGNIPCEDCQGRGWVSTEDWK